MKELESSLSSKDVVKCNAVDFISKSIGTDVKYCIVDALDEVESNQFSRVFREIKDFCENNKNTNVVFLAENIMWHLMLTFSLHLQIFHI